MQMLAQNRCLRGHALATGQNRAKISRSRLVVQARDRAGPSGIHVGGYSPTSPKGWEVMRHALQEAGVKLVSPQEVIFAAERGAVVVDVRPESDYDAGHIPGALNVPFYQPITGWSAFKVARRVGYAMFGVMNGTEVNPDFAAEVKCLVDDPQQQAVILYCSQGGVLESNENHKRGWQTRSLVAAYDLLQEGVANLSVMKGGYTEWVNGGRDIEVMELVEDGADVVADARQ